MASKAIPWGLAVVLAAPLTGCEGGGTPSGDGANAKAAPAQPSPTTTAKEKNKKSAGLKSAAD